MRFSTIAVTFFAALATAEHNHGVHQFRHRRAMNTTASTTSSSSTSSSLVAAAATSSLATNGTEAATNGTEAETDPLTTLTVFATQIKTVYGCAATVTNCPARSSTAGVVVTETIALTTTICPVSAAASVSAAVVSSAVVKAASESAADSVLTYTLGVGASATVVTTTVKHTRTAVQYVVSYCKDMHKYGH